MAKEVVSKLDRNHLLDDKGEEMANRKLQNDLRKEE